MAALSDLYPTYLDWAKRRDPDGGMAKIVEILALSTPIIEDMVVTEANGFLSHRTTVRSGLPSGTWRRLNYGVPSSKTKTAQVNDSIGTLEVYAEVDKLLADLNGNTAAWRMSEEKGFMQGLSHQMATTVIDGNTDTDPERFMGLGPRFDDTTATNGRMLIESATAGGGTNVNSSIWGIVWSPEATHGIFPKGMSDKVGLQVNDLGQETLTDGAGGKYEGYRTHYQWMAGLCVRDWRQVTRIHIDETDISGATPANRVIDLMIDAYNQLQMPNDGRLVWYTTRAIKTYLDKEAVNKSNMALSLGQADGAPQTTFWGKPVKHLETLVNWTEADFA